MRECGVLLANDAAEWEQHRSRLVEHEDERRVRVAELERSMVEERNLESKSVAVARRREPS